MAPLFAPSHVRRLAFAALWAALISTAPFGTSANTARGRVLVDNGVCEGSSCPNEWDELAVNATFPSCPCVYPINIQFNVVSRSSLEATFVNMSLLFSRVLSISTSQVRFGGLTIEGSNIVTYKILPLNATQFPQGTASTFKSKVIANNQSIFAILGNNSLRSVIQLEPPPPPPSSPPPPPYPPPVPVPPAPPTPPPPPSPPSTSAGSSSISAGIIAAIVGIIVLVSSLLLCCFVYFCFCSKTKKDPPEAEEKPKEVPEGEIANLPRPVSTRVFSFQELIEATDEFNPMTVLGEGGFGRVYKGKLRDGTKVAIKKLSGGGTQGAQEFLVEVAMLSRLHHKNLVKLLGYYISRDNVHQVLCYELVPNGTLEQWLHGNKSRTVLDWRTRMRIALGAARGLAYLHEDSQPCVIHRDFKASNILLTYNFTAKVGDFGLAKQAPETLGGYISTRVMGTFGYVAPEYAMTGHLLVKSDVYSYGVVLLELLTGRRPVDMNQPSGEENLVTWARPLLSNQRNLPRLVDPRLNGNFLPEDLVHVAAIASACVSQDIVHRPSMSEVVQSLNLIMREEEDFSSECLLEEDEDDMEVDSYAYTADSGGQGQSQNNAGNKGSRRSDNSTSSDAPLLRNPNFMSPLTMEFSTNLSAEDLNEGR